MKFLSHEKRKEIVSYFFEKLWRTLFLIGAGLLFALTLSSFINSSLIEGLKERINIPLQILYAELIGFISPGPRYIIYPLLLKLLDMGVGMGVIIALISGHVLIEPSTFLIETGFFGYKFPLKRFFAALIVTYLAGIITVLIGDYFL